MPEAPGYTPDVTDPYEKMHFSHKRVHPDSLRFELLLEEVKRLHRSKSQDYGTTDDPFANIRMTEDFGLPAWVGVAIRMNDKMKRLQSAVMQLLDSGQVKMAHDSLQDDFLDLCNYGAIGALMAQEWEWNSVLEGNTQPTE